MAGRPRTPHREGARTGRIDVLMDLVLALDRASCRAARMVRANDDKIDDTMENLRVATENLDQLTDSVKQRPWSLIRIKQPKERAVPQQK